LRPALEPAGISFFVAKGAFVLAVASHPAADAIGLSAKASGLADR